MSKGLLNEGCWAFPTTTSKVKALFTILKDVKNKSPKYVADSKVDPDAVQTALHNIFGDDDLFDTLNDTFTPEGVIFDVRDRLKEILGSKNADIPGLQKPAMDALRKFASSGKISEENSTGNVAGFNTPKAFAKKGEGDNRGTEASKSLGFKKATVTGKSQVKPSGLNEIAYKDYKNLDMPNSKKVNLAINDVATSLYQIENFMKQNSKLMKEEGMGTDKYWRSTVQKVLKISERIGNIKKQLKEFGIKELADKGRQDKIDFIVACSTELPKKHQWRAQDLAQLPDSKLEVVLKNRLNMPECDAMAKTYGFKKGMKEVHVDGLPDAIKKKVKEDVIAGVPDPVKKKVNEGEGVKAFERETGHSFDKIKYKGRNDIIDAIYNIGKSTNPNDKRLMSKLAKIVPDKEDSYDKWRFNTWLLVKELLLRNNKLPKGTKPS